MRPKPRFERQIASVIFKHMTNEHYLIVSYFLFAFVSVCLGMAAYRFLRTPFAALADLIVGKSRGPILKRLLSFSLTIAAVVGFLGVSYTQNGCTNYEAVVKDRAYLVEVNRNQLAGAGDWIVYAVLAWGVLVVIGLVAARKRQSKQTDRT